MDQILVNSSLFNQIQPVSNMVWINRNFFSILNRKPNHFNFLLAKYFVDQIDNPQKKAEYNSKLNEWMGI